VLCCQPWGAAGGAARRACVAGPLGRSAGLTEVVPPREDSHGEHAVALGRHRRRLAFFPRRGADLVATRQSLVGSTALSHASSNQQVRKWPSATVNARTSLRAS
jgi:hypothetical protein